MAVRHLILYGYILIACMWLFASSSYIPKLDGFANAEIQHPRRDNKRRERIHLPLDVIMADNQRQLSELNLHESLKQQTKDDGMQIKLFDKLTNKATIMSSKPKIYLRNNKLSSSVDPSKKIRQNTHMANGPMNRVGGDLSYARFEYRTMTLYYQNMPKSNLTVTLAIVNVGDADGSDVLQCYVSWLNTTLPVPRKQLVYFDSIHLNANEDMAYAFILDWMSWAYWNNGTWTVQTGNMTLCCGDEPPPTLTASNILCSNFTVYGNN